MKLQDLVSAKNVIIQILWGEKTIEFNTEVLERNVDGVYVTPYLHGGQPLSLNIDASSGVVCNIFGDSPENGKRISWRNVVLNTVDYKGQTVYALKTAAFNSEAKADERRGEDRVKVTKNAVLYDAAAKKTVDVRINDISDGGISFYAPATYEPETNIFWIRFNDGVNGQTFNINVKCRTVRTSNRVGTVFYGCKVAEDNAEYLLYGCLMRLVQNASEENM